MDPQSQAFTPYSSNNDTWRLQSDFARLQQAHADHAERIARLERRQDDDARLKSVWGNSSPFPSVLSGTPQQAPLQQPPADQFRTFDDEATNLMSSLHLDAEEEPRRGMGATSRANSVRFDESANQNHFSHASRPSFDYLSRTSSGIGGGLQLSERSASHKSDGRASSAHSIRSAASGRANSLNLDTAYGPLDSTRSPLETPALAPGLLLLGSVPAIIRCWMNTNFKHDALLYAAICTGSHKSWLDARLIEKLGFDEDIVTNDVGARTVELPVYFPEAVPHPASSRSSSPAPQLPSLTVNFCVVDAASHESGSKAIQIFIGSDILRSHSADILFSSNSMTLFDDDRSKLSIPLVRPEDEAVFNSLYVSSRVPQDTPLPQKDGLTERPYLNGLGQSSSGASASSTTASPPPGKYRPPPALTAESNVSEPTRPGAGGTGLDNEARPASRASTASRPSLSLLNARADSQTTTSDTSTPPAGPRSASGTSAIWSNWRRDGQTPAASSSVTPSPLHSAGLDWAAASKNRESSYQRKDTGIKVLKPKSTSRTFSTSNATTLTAGTASPGGEGKSSRFFDEGRRKSGLEPDRKEDVPPGSQSQTPGPAPSPAPKARTNPIGGASAFSWLNPNASSVTKG